MHWHVQNESLRQSAAYSDDSDVSYYLDEDDDDEDDDEEDKAVCSGKGEKVDGGARKKNISKKM